MSRKKKNSTAGNIMWGTTVGLLVTGLVAIAIGQQLRLPPEERTWHGMIADRIPYDFRPPTMERLRATFWNKDTAEILVPQAFGVGWTVNLYPLLHPGTVQNQP